MKKILFIAELSFFAALCLGIIVVIYLLFHTKPSAVLGTTTFSHPTASVTTPTPTAIITETAEETCNDLLVLVDKTYGLPAAYVPPDLVYLSKYSIPVASSNLQGRLIEIPDLKRMITDAKADGIDLIVLSPYRSYQTQLDLHASYVASEGEASADASSAIAGHSQHQLGTAIDFSTDEIANQLDQGFGATKAGKWMALNAYKYGFYIAYPQGAEAITGYEYEPWHYRYIGVDNARRVYDSELTLEEYLQRYGVIPRC